MRIRISLMAIWLVLAGSLFAAEVKQPVGALGFKWGTPKADVASKLKLPDSRFTVAGEYDNLVVLEGDFANRKSSSIGLYFDSAGVLTQMVVVYENDDSSAYLSEMFTNVVAELVLKYRKPDAIMEEGKMMAGSKDVFTGYRSFENKDFAAIWIFPNGSVIALTLARGDIYINLRYVSPAWAKHVRESNLADY